MTAPKTKTKRTRRSRAPREKSVEAEARNSVEIQPKRGGLVRVVLFVILATLAAALCSLLFVYPNGDGPGRGAIVEIDITPSQPPAELANALAARGVIGNAALFALYVRLRGGTGQLVAGKHLLTDDLSPREVMARLERHGSRVHVTIPEGWTRFDIAKKLEAAHICTVRAFLNASLDPLLLKQFAVNGPSFEGYLFPATYDFEADSDAAEIVKTMTKEFERRYSNLEEKFASSLSDLANSMGWGRREIVILASMIEKEAVVDDERPIIASVFINRLRDPAFSPKILQCDPTAGYGCLVGSSNACLKYTGKITHDIVADEDNLYNTYKHPGLPPGPISNPGDKSLAAAMSPALTHYFYFVAKGSGRHNFSENYSGHLSAVHDGGTKPANDSRGGE